MGRAADGTSGSGATGPLVRWVAGVRRRAWLVALGGLALAALALTFALDTLRIDTDRDAMLAPDLPFRQNDARLAEAFPGLFDVLVLVVDADVPESARATALDLARRLRARTDLFADVHVPRADPFLERAALLYLDADELEALATRLTEVQPFLGRLSRDPSPRALFELLAQAYDAQLDRAVPLERVADRIADVLAERRAGQRGVLSWQELLASGDDDDETGARRQLVLARVRPDFGRLFPAGAAIRYVRDLRAELGWTGERGVRVALTGQPALAHEELETVQRGSRTIGLAVLVLVAAALSFGLRSWRLVVASLVTLACGLAATAGFAALAVGHLNLISIAFAVLYLGLGVDYAIHLGLRYREALDAERDPERAWAAATGDVGGSLFVCSLTTALGFFAFVPTAYAGVSELGLISGTGMLISFVVTITMMPALLTLLPLAPGGSPPPAAWLSSGTERFARPIRWGAAVLGLVSLAALPGVRFDRNPLELRDPDAESVATFRELLKTSATPPWSVNALTDDAARAAAIADAWRASESVGRVVRLESFVPSNQDAKLDRLFELELALGDLRVARDPAPGPLDDERAALAELREVLARYGASAPEDASAGRLTDELDALAVVYDERVAADVGERLLATLPPNLERLERAIATEGFGLADLPPDLAGRWVTADGLRRVEAFSADDLDDVGAMRRFVADVQAAAPHATGSPVKILASGDAVVGAFKQAFLVAFATTVLVLGLLLRSLRDVVLVLVPLGLAGLWTTATLVWSGQPFNFANVIGLPLLLGIGVDSGVHVLHRARAGGANPLASSTARAVVYSSLTTFASFANLSFSPHPGTASMGLILAIGVAFTLIATLVVLPALLAGEAASEASAAGRA